MTLQSVFSIFPVLHCPLGLAEPQYELAPRPSTLFDDTPMRRPAKAALASLLLSLVPPGPAGVPKNAVHIVDGGCLLPGVRQVPEGSGEQGKMEETGCEITCGPTTILVVKG